MKNKKGFTLVELLAVIAILAILVVIALPNVINMYNKAQKETFLTEAKKVYSESEKKFISNSISNKQTKIINSEDNTKLDMTGKKLQYCVILNNSGKVTSMKVSNGKWIASLDANKQIDELSIDDLVEGNLDGYNCSNSSGHQSNTPKALNCTFDGDMTQGAEYVNGQYTYRYKQEQDGVTNESNKTTLEWVNISTDGWGVKLTDKDSTVAVTSDVCTTINNKPVVSMSYAFNGSKATSINLSNSNTSNVTNMIGIFSNTQVTNLNISNLNTSKVTNMFGMFWNCPATTLDLSSFDTSKVIDMGYMFNISKATTLDLSNFNTRNVTNMAYMLANTNASKIDVSSFDTRNVTNMVSLFFQSNFTAITGLDKFNTSNVTTMNAMFWGTKVSTIDASSFDTSKVVDMVGMFIENPNLTTIYVSDKFVTSSLYSDRKRTMFNNSTKLVGGAGTVYDSTKTDATYAHIDEGTANPGYFTPKTRSENNTSAESRIRDTDLAN